MEAIWSTAEVPTTLESKHLLLHLHGFGSNHQDLAGLFPHLPADLVQVSLRAPLTLAAGSYAWFPLTTPGSPAPESVNEAAAVVLDWIEQELVSKNPKSISLLGFSQGGAMVIQLFRLAPKLFKVGVNLSGFSVPGVEPGDSELKALKPALFWGRDIADPVIVSTAIERSLEFLPEHFALTKKEYPGIGHSISFEELTELSEFLRSQLNL